MFTITVSQSELDAIRSTHPQIAEKAKAVPVKAVARPGAKRYVMKKTPIPANVVREAEAWDERARDLRENIDTERVQRIMERDARILRDVVALHRGLPAVTE